MLAERFTDLRCLEGELSSGYEDKGLNDGFGGVDFVESWNDKSTSLARAVLRDAQNCKCGELASRRCRVLTLARARMSRPVHAIGTVAKGMS